MQASDVLAVVGLLDSSDIEAWVDGGWGVDALLGRQTRPHGDLDIAIQHKDVPKLRDVLYARGYRDVPRDDTKEWNFVLGDDEGHEVDVHSYTLGPKGEHAYGIEYPAESLTGTGVVAGRSVRCISAEYAVRFRGGYQLRKIDIDDVGALCAKFGFERPASHEGYLWTIRTLSDGMPEDWNHYLYTAH